MGSRPNKYQVIARKYRPQSFECVVGQEVIVTTLKNALRFNRLAHAYLFCGCRGTGKTTLARVFAKALNCSCLTAECEPCNACPSCLDIIAGRSLDVLEIDGASNRGIDDVRQINETIGYAPSGKYKIYIIDEVHMLTKEAFNALLKTLEEPPENVKFFFATTEPHKILPTILSRCQRFDLSRISFEEIKKKLASIAEDLKIVCEEEVLALIANLSEGSLRDAESLFDQVICYAEHPLTLAKVSAALGILPRTVFFSLDKAFEEQNLSFAFELAGDIFASGKDLCYFIDNLIEHYRSLLKIKLKTPVVLATARRNEQYASSSAIYTEEQCLYILDYLIHWQQQIGKTPFKRISLELILLHILRSKHRVTLPSLVKRLGELERQTTAAPIPEKAQEVLQPTPVIPAEKAPEIPSLEEALIKKIREKIEASPPVLEEPKDLPLKPTAASSQPSLILTKSQWEAASVKEQNIPSVSDEIFSAEPAEKLPFIRQPSALLNKNTDSSPSTGNQSRYDTLVRFAAVELEGIIKS